MEVEGLVWILVFADRLLLEEEEEDDDEGSRKTRSFSKSSYRRRRTKRRTRNDDDEEGSLQGQDVGRHHEAPKICLCPNSARLDTMLAPVLWLVRHAW